MCASEVGCQIASRFGFCPEAMLPYRCTVAFTPSLGAPALVEKRIARTPSAVIVVIRVRKFGLTGPTWIAADTAVQVPSMPLVVLVRHLDRVHRAGGEEAGGVEVVAGQVAPLGEPDDQLARAVLAVDLEAVVALVVDREDLRRGQLSDHVAGVDTEHLGAVAVHQHPVAGCVGVVACHRDSSVVEAEHQCARLQLGDHPGDALERSHDRAHVQALPADRVQHRPAAQEAPLLGGDLGPPMVRVL